MTPLVDPGTDCEDELPDPADIQSVPDHVMDAELQSVFMDVASLPSMITPVSDVDRACCAPEYVNAAVLPVEIRAPTAATLAVFNVLSPIRSPAAEVMMSEIGTPPVNAVPEALLICNTDDPVAIYTTEEDMCQHPHIPHVQVPPDIHHHSCNHSYFSEHFSEHFSSDGVVQF